jgi:cell division protease FtsH
VPPRLIVFNHLSTGAADDLARVTDIARAMVTRYGMSERLGNVALEKDQRSFLNPNPLGNDAWERSYSDETATAIDDEVRAIVQGAMDRTLALLTERRGLLETTARRLLEKETLDEAELLQWVSTGEPQPADRTLVQLEHVPQDRSGSRSAKHKHDETRA